MSHPARAASKKFIARPSTVAVDDARRRALCLAEFLEERRLFTVSTLPAFPPPNTTGALGSTGTVELTRYVDNAPTNHTVEMTFPTGTVDIQTFDTEVPQNVENFLRYVRGGFDGKGYTGTYFQRFVSGFVLQGGSQYVDGTAVNTTGQATVPDEEAAGAGHSNVRGTIAFARQSGDPNSATSGFFFNLADNSSNLDNQNGGFDVLGQITSGTASGQTVADPTTIVDNLAQLPARSRVVQDAVVLEPGVTFTATSDNPANISVVNPTGPDGKLQLQYNGSVGSTANITVNATEAGQATPAVLHFTATVAEPSVSVMLGGTSGNKSLTYTDANGTVGTITPKGAGTTTVTFTGAGVQQSAAKGKVTVTGTSVATDTIAIAGSNAGSSLTIASRGNNNLTVGSVTADGPMNAITAPTSTLTGTLSTGGTLGKLTLASSQNGVISIGGAANGKASTLAFGTVTDTDISAAPAIKSIRATSIAVSGNVPVGITTPALGSLTTSGDSAEDITTTGTIKTIKVGGNFSGNVQAVAVASVTVSGNMESGGLTLSAPFNAHGGVLKTLKVGGEINNVTVQANGNVGKISANALSNTAIFIAVASQGLPATASDFGADASVGSIAIKTTSSNYGIAAARFGKVDLGTVAISNNGNPFGISADRISSLVFSTGPAVHTKFSNLNTQADFTAQLQKQAPGLTLQDFQVTLV